MSLPFMVLGGVEDALDPVLLAVGVGREDRLRGLKEIQLGAQAIGIEVQQAELYDVTLAMAVRDPARYPRLNATHNGIEDLLRIDMPQELQPFVDRIRAPQSRPEFMKIANQLVLMAAKGDAAEGAFARFVLFELLRFVRLIVTWRDRPSDLRLGLDDAEFDRLAEAHMQTEFPR